MPEGDIPPIVGIATADSREISEGSILRLLRSIPETTMGLVLVLRGVTDTEADELSLFPQVLAVVRTPRCGLSHARNEGLRRLAMMEPRPQQVVTFPDDDGFYPPGLIQTVRRHMDTGKDLILGTYGEEVVDPASQPLEALTLRKAFRYANSVGLFIRWHLITALDGFDENLGVGSNFLQSGEDLDFIVRACRLTRFRAFAPTFQIIHPRTTMIRPERAGAYITIALRNLTHPATWPILARGIVGSLLGVNHVPRKTMIRNLRGFPRRSAHFA